MAMISGRQSVAFFGYAVGLCFWAFVVVFIGAFAKGIVSGEHGPLEIFLEIYRVNMRHFLVLILLWVFVGLVIARTWGSRKELFKWFTVGAMIHSTLIVLAMFFLPFA